MSRSPNEPSTWWRVPEYDLVAEGLRAARWGSIERYDPWAAFEQAPERGSHVDLYAVGAEGDGWDDDILEFAKTHGLLGVAAHLPNGRLGVVPSPSSYVEDVGAFSSAAKGFRRGVRALLTGENAEDVAELDALLALASPILVRRDGAPRLAWIYPSLLVAAALMVAEDVRLDRARLCEHCGAYFVSAGGSARFCSPSCHSA